MFFGFVKQTFKKCLFLLFFGLSACGSSTSSSYQIAMDPYWYSIDGMGREKNLVGFSTDLIAEIAHKTKSKLSLRSVNWDTLFEGLKEDQYQGILSGLSPYNFNQEIYTFSDVFLETGPVLVVPVNSSASSLNNFSGKEVGVISNSTAVFIVEKYPGILIRLYDSIPKMLNDVLLGTIDATVVSLLPAEAYCQDLYQGELKIVTAPLNDEGLRLITMRGQAEPLIQDFNRGLRELKSNKEYAKLLQKWSLIGAPQ